ncbi:MAG TPA: hypothetical protein VG474_14220 [Solirubrobacteraceae bacterium]|nr:hypothetical protein [Solirubrobacteraceae bacterium]
MSPLEPNTPPVGEEIHLPGPSLQPVLVAFGVTITLVGVTLSLYLVAAGLILTFAVVVRWIGDTRREMAELPEDLGDH